MAGMNNGGTKKQKREKRSQGPISPSKTLPVFYFLLLGPTSSKGSTISQVAPQAGDQAFNISAFGDIQDLNCSRLLEMQTLRPHIPASS
jgi:hypothetical protein